MLNFKKTTKMVTVKKYHLRKKEGEEGTYVSLELQGDLELVQSQNTSRFYASARRCFIYSTFDEATAKLIVGRQIPGSIVRMSCEPYDYTVPETAEVIKLAYKYDYVPEEVKAVSRKELKQLNTSGHFKRAITDIFQCSPHLLNSKIEQCNFNKQAGRKQK
jgi:hypothetical protein